MTRVNAIAEFVGDVERHVGADDDLVGTNEGGVYINAVLGYTNTEVVGINEEVVGINEEVLDISEELLGIDDVRCSGIKASLARKEVAAVAAPSPFPSAKEPYANDLAANISRITEAGASCKIGLTPG